MTHLADTRPIVSITTASTNPSVIGADLGYLLGRHPGLELASIRLIREDQGVHIAGRVGTIAQPVCDCYPGGFSPDSYEGPQHHCSVHGHGNDLAPSECPVCIAERECPSCHTTGARPHTEYCQASAVCDDPAPHAPHIRFDDSPHTNCPGRRRCSCTGLGINPDCPRHNRDPAEDEPEHDEQDATRDEHGRCDGCGEPLIAEHTTDCRWYPVGGYPNPSAFESHTVTIGVRATVHHRSLCKPEVCGWDPLTSWMSRPVDVGLNPA